MAYHEIELVDHNALSPWLQGRTFEDLKSEYDSKGYLVFENVMPIDKVEFVREALQPYMAISVIDSYR